MEARKTTTKMLSEGEAYLLAASGPVRAWRRRCGLLCLHSNLVIDSSSSFEWSSRLKGVLNRKVKRCLLINFQTRQYHQIGFRWLVFCISVRREGKTFS